MQISKPALIHCMNDNGDEQQQDILYLLVKKCNTGTSRGTSGYND